MDLKPRGSEPIPVEISALPVRTQTARAEAKE
jgi:hypothetical protein